MYVIVMYVIIKIVRYLQCMYVCMYVCMCVGNGGYRALVAVRAVCGEVRPHGREEEQRAEQRQTEQNAEEQPAVSFSDAVPERNTWIYTFIRTHIYIHTYIHTYLHRKLIKQKIHTYSTYIYLTAMVGVYIQMFIHYTYKGE
jgi:hypothetical protein